MTVVKLKTKTEEDEDKELGKYLIEQLKRHNKCLKDTNTLLVDYQNFSERLLKKQRGRIRTLVSERNELESRIEDLISQLDQCQEQHTKHD